jgi:hypothetical protein
MVNQWKTPRGPMAPVNKDGTPRAKPGKTPRPDDNKTDRLVMRLHPDVTAVLDFRAAEKGITRSKFVEQLLVGFLGSDPRNPKMNAIGKIERTGASPLMLRADHPHKFAERWQRFVSGYSGIFGAPPPVDWNEGEERFWSPVLDEKAPLPEDQWPPGDTSGDEDRK